MIDIIFLYYSTKKNWRWHIFYTKQFNFLLNNIH